MWKQGTIRVMGITFQWEAKVFENPSRFGINSGRVSKLSLGEKFIVNYDRGWDVKPRTIAARRAVNQILAMYA